MSNKHPMSYEWMTIALALAEKGLPADVPVGCLILVPDNTGTTYRIVGEGYNTRERECDPTGHAEIMAIQQAAKALGSWRLSGCIAVVTLEPCPMCAAALLQCRVESILYGASSPQEGALGSQLNLAKLYERSMSIQGGILESACQEQLSAFFKQTRSTSSN